MRGVTGIVILGRGEMTFSPTPAPEKGQVKIYSGSDTLNARFDWVYLRAHPAEFDRRLDVTAFHTRDVDPRDLRRAEAVFQENLPRSFGIDLADLSRERWSVIPKFGDLVSEMNADRGHLTYMKSTSDPEDIRFFDRTRNRTISIYPSKEKLAARGPYFNEDDSADFDIVNYDIDASFDPRREWIDGKATLLLTARTRPGVVADPQPCRTTVVAVGHQPPARLSDGAACQRAGRYHHQPAAAASAGRAARSGARPTVGGCPRFRPSAKRCKLGNDFFSIQPLPSYIYTGRSGWYPQGEVTDYATATLRLRVPDGYTAVASGSLDDGYPRQLAAGRAQRSVVGVQIQRDAAGAIPRLGNQPLRVTSTPRRSPSRRSRKTTTCH